MDTLLTAFLSSGMHHQQQQSAAAKTLPKSGNYKVSEQRSWDDIDLIDFMMSSVDHIYDIGLIPNPTELYPVVCQYEKKDHVNPMCSTTTTDLLDSHCHNSTILANEVDIQPLCADATTDIELSFSSYIQHQIYHKLEQRRISSTNYIAVNCCRKLGYTFGKDHFNIQRHICCGVKMDTFGSLCPCGKQENGDRSCEVHKLVIQNMKVTEKGSSWMVTHLEDFRLNKKPDKYVSNPFYDMTLETLNFLDVSTDSFEIEFTEDNAEDGNTQINICSNNFQDFTFHIHGTTEEDEESDGDSESLIYETSDDEDDEFCFYSDVIEFESTKDVHIINSPFFETIPIDHEVKAKTVSKYHQSCVCTKENIVYSGNDAEKCDEDVKKVSFLEQATVHYLVAWKHAYNQCRKSSWVKMANDRAHFQRRINNVERILDPILRMKLKHCTATKMQ